MTLRSVSVSYKAPIQQNPNPYPTIIPKQSLPSSKLNPIKTGIEQTASIAIKDGGEVIVIEEGVKPQIHTR